ncbi:unnamed protein product [Blepharisma stoltei]|uniref:C2H2-type domain-containing protein n=1 Tax=Blepharisma stoltei TaxID=1481888 RepID=A0AAU9K7L7_9CILI|nr:unnamed protein product [Blepharisma stoltei]
MDTLCRYCGVFEAYYQCDSCKKQFCIEDWFKAHPKALHQQLRIILPINKKSSETLLKLLEFIKKESLIFLIA